MESDKSFLRTQDGMRDLVYRKKASEHCWNRERKLNSGIRTTERAHRENLRDLGRLPLSWWLLSPRQGGGTERVKLEGHRTTSVL